MADSNDITKIINDVDKNVNMNSYSRSLREYIKYSNCLMQAMKTRKKLNFNKRDGIYELLDEHMDKMMSNICRDSETIKLDNFKLRDMDHEIRKVRYGIGKKIENCSHEEFNKFVRKYFDKAIKSGKRVDELNNAMGNTGTDYGNAIHKIIEQYTKLNKGSNFKF